MIQVRRERSEKCDVRFGVLTTTVSAYSSNAEVARAAVELNSLEKDNKGARCEKMSAVGRS